MARPTWKGTITFGLVGIPVTLYSAEDPSKDIGFRLLDSRNKARVRYERVNEVTGKAVPWENIVKGYEVDEDSYVLMTDEDFERAAVEATKTIEIEDFVGIDEIEYRYFEKPYVLVPAKGGEKGYVVLREALAKSGKVGISKVVIQTRQHLAAVISQGDALMLCILRFADELRNLKQFDLPAGKLADYKVSAREVDMANQLINAMTSPWKPQKYHDDYRDALKKWIDKKAASGGETPALQPEEERKPAGKIIDIMDLLKKSVAQRERGHAVARHEPRDVQVDRAAKPKPARVKHKAKSKAMTRRRAS
jgi:DNA end-binding protein Ku